MPKNTDERIFTKWLVHEDAVPATGSVDEHVGDSFIAQEDIYIVGCMLGISMVDHVVGNDGYVICTAEISLSGQMMKDSVLQHGNMKALWNTVPAFGYENTYQETIMFAKENWVSLKEEGTVYLNMAAGNSTAAIRNVDAWAIIFYRKQ